MVPFLARIVLVLGLAMGALHSSEPAQSGATPSSETRIAGQKYEFAAIDFPGATGTVVNDISNTGDFVGIWVKGGGSTPTVHGFVFVKGVFRRLDYPKAKSTFVQGINDRGEIVGDYQRADGRSLGFIYKKGKFRTFACPSTRDTYVSKINASGAFVGDCVDKNGFHHGFLFRDEKLERVDHPRAVLDRFCGTSLFGINQTAVVVGTVQTSKGPLVHKQAFSLDAKSGLNAKAFKTFAVKDSYQTVAYGINDAGTVIGQYFPYVAEKPRRVDVDRPRSFVRRDGNLVRLDAPGSRLTGAVAINARGEVVGYYDDARGKRHGFKASPT